VLQGERKNLKTLEYIYCGGWRRRRREGEGGMGGKESEGKGGWSQ
jgi:hypothetical protein